MRSLLLVSALLTLVACPGDRRGEAPEREPDEVAILLVVDDSNSMTAVHEALQANFGALLAGLEDADAAWRIGVTTVDMQQVGNGRRGGLRSRSPVGENHCDPVFASSTEENPALTYADLVDLGVEGTGQEAGLLSAVWALCKAQEAEFWDTLADRGVGDPVRTFCDEIPAEERTCNRGFLFDGGDVGVLIVSDEGDFSNDLSSSNAADYVAALQELGSDVTVTVVGPTYREGPLDCDGTELDLQGPCNAFGSPAASIDRYQDVACGADGTYAPVEVTASGDPQLCEPADFEQILGDFARSLF